MSTPILWMLSFVLVAITGCVMPPPDRHHGPPEHAPAHGYRAHYQYRYYPEVGIYFDRSRTLYFYRDGGWRSAPTLPKHMRLVGTPIMIDLDDDVPYGHYDEHRAKYPPGQLKNKKYKY